ncbi:uncharacterized protein LOC127865759 isoform X2 [Dreissena polymorpha]|nr:uncharacterized protein LOC127865759 isoform X2 [Dreissena polymorpha]
MVLGESSLAFFKDQKSESCIGSIDLTEITDVKSIDESSFVIITSTKTYTFTPCTKGNVVEWICAIKKCVNRDTQIQQNSTKSVVEEIHTVLPEAQSSIFGVKLKSTKLSRSSSESESRNSLQEGDAKRSNVNATSSHNDCPVQLELSEGEPDKKATGKVTEVSITRSWSESINKTVDYTAECRSTDNTKEESKQTSTSNMKYFDTTFIEVDTNNKPTATYATDNTGQNKSMEEINSPASYELPVNCCKNITEQKRDNRPLFQTFEITNSQTKCNSETIPMHANNVDRSNEWTCSTGLLADQTLEASEAQDDEENIKHDNGIMENCNSPLAAESETTSSKWKSEQSSPSELSKLVSVTALIKSSNSENNDVSKVQMRRPLSGLNESDELTKSKNKKHNNHLTEEVDMSEVVMRNSYRTSRNKSYRAEQSIGASGVQQNVSEATSTVEYNGPYTSADDEQSKTDDKSKEDEVLLADDVFANIFDTEESAVQMPMSSSTGVYRVAIEKLKRYLVEHRNGFEYDVDRSVHGSVDRLRQYFKIRQ